MENTMKMLALVEKPAPWRGEGKTHTVIDLPKHVMQRFPTGGGFDDMIYWTPDATSYCLMSVEGDYHHAPWLLGDKTVALLSINGGGEVRWQVSHCTGKEDRLAVEAYGLVERDRD